MRVIDWTLTYEVDEASIQVQPCDRISRLDEADSNLVDGLGALGDGGELPRTELARGEHEADRSLDLGVRPGRERLLLGVAAELGGLERDALEDVVDEGVHDRHAFRLEMPDDLEDLLG